MGKDVLSEIDDRIMSLCQARDLIYPIVDVPGEIQTWLSNDKVRIDVKSTEQLHEARAYLREKLGSWRDEVGLVFASCGRGIAIYKSGTPYEIWLFFDINNPPEGLVKDGCRFVERTTTDYDFVCDK